MSRIDPNQLLALPGHSAAVAPFRTIRDWTAANATRFGEAPALGGLDRPFLSHAGLHDAITTLADHLRASGLGRGDVVAVSLPNGPEAFVAIMAAASVACVIAIGPDEPTPAFAPLLGRLPVKAAIVRDDRPGGVRGVAEQLGLPVLVIHLDHGQPAGCFSIATPLPTLGHRAPQTQPDDAALLARTAGTTDAPKLVAVSQVSLLLTSSVLADWLELTPADRSLCVMPFTHLHGIIRSTLPVLLRGGAAVSCPGFDPIGLPAWIDACQPTMMTAAAGVLRAIRLRIAESGWRPRHSTLRLLVSGSDAIDPDTVSGLVEALGVEVREFYGLSEASPMLAASGAGKPARAEGAIGPAVEPWSVACFDDAGQRLPPGMEGELGATGGLINPTIGPDCGWATRTSGAWVLTGDRGRIDEYGAVHVVGRLDERLNRGGKKIAPEAIESVLVQHPEVRQALVFPIPDDLLGDRVGSVIIPAPGNAPTERELRTFVAERLPDYMVPDRVVALDSLPVSSVGKVVRRDLARQLTETLAQPASWAEPRFTPATPTEQEVARLVATALQYEGFDLEKDFEDIGGNSFLALELLMAIEEELGCQLSPAEFLADRSVAGLARLVDRQRAQTKARRVIPLRAGNGGPVLFLAHSTYGTAAYFNAALEQLGPDVTVHALHWEREKGEPLQTLEIHAAYFIAAMRAIQPSGPYCLAGHSFAAHLALEVAQQLFAAGEHVAFLAVLDDSADLDKRRFGIRHQAPGEGTRDYARHMLVNYVPVAYPGDLWLYRAYDNADDLLPDPDLGWRSLVCGALHRLDVAGDHTTMVGKDHVGGWIGEFRESLLTAWNSARSGAPQRQIAADRLEQARIRRTRADVQATTDARRSAKNGDLATEIDRYRAAIAFDADQPFWVYRNLAEALDQHGDQASAADAYRAAAEREAIPIFGYGLLGSALSQLGRRAEAKAAFHEAARFESEDILAQRAMVSLEQRQGFMEQAEMRLRRLVVLSDPWSYGKLTRWLARQGQFDEAIRFARDACAKHPSDAYLQGLVSELLAQRTVAA